MTGLPAFTEQDEKSVEPLYHLGPKPGGLAEMALEVMRRTFPPRDYERENQKVLEARLRRKEGQA